MKKIAILFLVLLTAIGAQAQTSYSYLKGYRIEVVDSIKIGGVWYKNIPTGIDTTALSNRINAKQNTLISGTTIKTVNGTSLLGAGDVSVVGGAGKQDTIYILSMGQSNEVGGSTDYSSNSDTASDDRLQVWDSIGQQWVKFICNKDYGRLWAFNPPSPKAVFYFGRKMVREKNAVVRVVVSSNSATPIDDWHNGTSRGWLLNGAILQTTQANVPKYSYMIWGQGEAVLGTETEDGYNLKWDSVKSALRSYSWFPKTTPIAMFDYARNNVMWTDENAVGVPGVDGYAQQRAWRRRVDVNKDPYDGFMDTKGVPLNTISDNHYNSLGLKIIGEERLPKCFDALPHAYWDENPWDKPVYIGGNKVKTGEFLIGSNDTVAVKIKYYNSTALVVDQNKTTVGFGAGTNIGSGIAMGQNAMPNNTGSGSIGIGLNALYGSTVADGVIAIGNFAFNALSTGTNNIAIGYLAGGNQSSGVSNTYVGYFAGNSITSGSYNTILGVYGYAGVLNNTIAIADGGAGIGFYKDANGKIGLGTATPYYYSKVTIAANGNPFIRTPLHFDELPPIYADDAAAGTAGLTAGDVYILSDGTLKVKLP